MFLHIFFVIVHILCLLFAFFGLVISIPLHIIITMMRGQRKKMDEQTKILKEQNELLKQKLDKK